jgi:hypothetical protein
VLFGPERLPGGLEFSVCEVPRLMRRDLALVFPPGCGAMHAAVPRLLAVLTGQRASVELVEWGPEAAAQKDLLLERFAAWAARVRERLRARGFADCDYVDPCSGLPTHARGCTVVWPEVDAFETLLKFRAYSAGGCRVIAHPEWGTRVYPATLFAAAPVEEVVRAAREAAEEPY